MKRVPFLVLALLCAAGARAYAASTAPATPAPAAPTEVDWRTPDPQNVLIIDTNKGRVIFELAPEAAPISTARVRDLARAKLYDGRAFFRVIDDFMAQTGDPADNGTGGSTKPNLPEEFTFRRSAQTPLVVVERSNGLESGFIGSLPVVSQTLDLALLTADNKVKAWGAFCAGVGGMARTQDPQSGNSQFFLMRGVQRDLDQKYTAFGRAIGGLDVIRSLKTGEPVAPPQDRMLTVRVLADMPVAERPTIRVIDTRGPWFRASVQRVQAEKAADFSVCDLDLPSQIK